VTDVEAITNLADAPVFNNLKLQFSAIVYVLSTLVTMFIDELDAPVPQLNVIP
jgi:hypothetical protein